MSYKLVEDNINIDDLEGEIAVDDDGNFYYSPDGEKLIPVPNRMIPTLKDAWEYARYKEEHKDDPNFDPQKDYERDMERIKRFRDRVSLEKESGEKIKNRAGTGNSKKFKARKESKYKNLKVISDPAEIIKDIDKFFENATSPTEEIVPYKKMYKDYVEQDPYENIAGADTFFTNWTSTTDYRIEEDEAEAQLILIYIDVSGSFYSASKQKIRDDVVKAIRAYESTGKIILKEKYFANNVVDGYTEEEKAQIVAENPNIDKSSEAYLYPNTNSAGVSIGGGTNINSVIADIKSYQKKDYILNIIILTDSDSSQNNIHDHVDIDGGAWVISAESLPKGLIPVGVCSVGENAYNKSFHIE